MRKYHRGSLSLVAGFYNIGEIVDVIEVVFTCQTCKCHRAILSLYAGFYNIGEDRWYYIK